MQATSWPATLPAAGGAWNKSLVDSGNVLYGVSCPTASLCAAVDGAGNGFTSVNPSGPATDWTGKVFAGNAAYAVSCVLGSGCLAVDASGYAYWGLPVPSNTAPPTISGLPTLGAPLTEGRGGWTEGATTFAVQWERCAASGASCSDIAGATGQTYLPTNGDLGATIRVLEVAANANGLGDPVESLPTGSVRPAPVIAPVVPPASVPGSGAGSVGRATVRGSTASLLATCQGTAGATCKVTATLAITETLRGAKVIAVTRAKKRQRTTRRVVTVGTTTVTLTAGRSQVVGISLNATGRRLLASRHTLPVRLTASQVTATSTSVVSTQVLTFKKSTKKRR